MSLTKRYLEDQQEKQVLSPEQEEAIELMIDAAIEAHSHEHTYSH